MSVGITREYDTFSARERRIIVVITTTAERHINLYKKTGTRKGEVMHCISFFPFKITQRLKKCLQTTLKARHALIFDFYGNILVAKVPKRKLPNF